MDIKTWEAYCEANITGGYITGGNPRNLPSSGLAIVEFLQGKGILHNNANILDVGCANGRLAIGLDLSTLTRFGYHGLEIVKPAIQFIATALLNKSHFHFSHLDVYNKRYWPQGQQRAEDVVFPVETMSQDVVIAFSLFTHLANEKQARHYLAEMLRVLKEGGVLFSTWSFTTLRDQVAINEKHTIWHVNQVLEMIPGGNFHFVSLDPLYKVAGVPNQVGIVVTK